MLAWANLHGGFVAGLGALVLCLTWRVCQNANAGSSGRHLATNTRHLWLALSLSVLATFVNPMGWRLWHYVLREVFHDTNRRYIAEWRAAHLTDDYELEPPPITFLVAALLLVGCLAHRGTSRSSRGSAHGSGSRVAFQLSRWATSEFVTIPLVAIWTAPVLTLMAASQQGKSRLRSPLTEQWTCCRGGDSAHTLTIVAVAAEPWPRIATAGDTLGYRASVSGGGLSEGQWCRGQCLTFHCGGVPTSPGSSIRTSWCPWTDAISRFIRTKWWSRT